MRAAHSYFLHVLDALVHEGHFGALVDGARSIVQDAGVLLENLLDHQPVELCAQLQRRAVPAAARRRLAAAALHHTHSLLLSYKYKQQCSILVCIVRACTSIFKFMYERTVSRN